MSKSLVFETLLRVRLPCAAARFSAVAVLLGAPASTRALPPIVDAFDWDEPDGESPPTGRAPPFVGESQPPPAVSDFGSDSEDDGPVTEDDRPDAPRDSSQAESRDERTSEDTSEDTDEDAAEARRHLRHSMLVERRRAMAVREPAVPAARALANPFGPAPRRDATDPSRGARLVRAIDRLELGVAGPIAPVTSFGVFDDGLRARVGTGLDALREPVGVRVRVEPMAMLASDGWISVPHERVRAALSATVSYRAPFEDFPAAWFFGGGAEHVRDHSTVVLDASATTTALVLRGGALFDAGALHGIVRGSVRLHVASRTASPSAAAPSQSIEVGLDVVARSGGAERSGDDFQVCGALRASYLAPDAGGSIVEEVHLDAMAGACVRDSTFGEIWIVAELALGNEPSWDRWRQGVHGGASLRWWL